MTILHVESKFISYILENLPYLATQEEPRCHLSKPGDNMTQNQSNRLSTYLSIVILAAIAAVGWYYYYSATSDIKSNLADNRAELDTLNNKLQEHQSTVDRLKADRNAIQDRLASSRKMQKEEIGKLQTTITRLEVEKAAIEDRFIAGKESQKGEVSKLQTNIINLQTSINTLQSNFDGLSEEKAGLLQQFNGEKAGLLQQLKDEKDARMTLIEQLELAVGEKESTEARLQQKISSAILTTSELEKELEKRQAEQDSLQEKMLSVSGEKSKLLTQLQQEQENKRIIANLKNRLEQELNESRVEISQLKNRMTVIKLTSEVLFGSGSDQISPDGKKVLSIIAESLNAYPDRAISVEGHTDNLPIRNASFPSNWALSVARSMAAVNYFQLSKQVDPVRLQVVGYGEFHPVASNETVTGRRLNRRIEIKLLPLEIGQ